MGLHPKSTFHPELASVKSASGALFQCPVSGRVQLTGPDPKATFVVTFGNGPIGLAKASDVARAQNRAYSQSVRLT